MYCPSLIYIPAFVVYPPCPSNSKSSHTSRLQRVLVHIVGPWTNIFVRICILNVIVGRKSTQIVSTQELLQALNS
ncbi:rCG28374 [Rattus norvegicus]|uniref:RCG28374 n=1 Tax=Rattus norvegicus TaxID=10116 RepID=A6IE07_RAT|nr:rCG28374 [Rattus norvegicus]